MSNRPRRNQTLAFKTMVAPAIKGDRTLVQRAGQFDVHPNQPGQRQGPVTSRVCTGTIVAEKRSLDLTFLERAACRTFEGAVVPAPEPECDQGIPSSE